MYNTTHNKDTVHRTTERATHRCAEEATHLMSLHKQYSIALRLTVALGLAILIMGGVLQISAPVTAGTCPTEPLDLRPSDVNDADYLIIGDLNAYAMEDPITALKDGGYTDLVNSYVGAEAYSYIYYGQSGYLDHALASPSLLSQVTGATIWHINADEPKVLDYNTEFKTTGQIESLYNVDPYRASDHDPVVIGLELRTTLYLPLVYRNGN